MKQSCAASRAENSVVIPGLRPAFELAVDPGDDERHIERQRKDEKPDRVEKRLVANLSDRFLDLVDRHHYCHKLIAPETRRNFDHSPDIGPAGHIVDAGSGHPAILVGGDETGNDRVVQIADLGRHDQHLTVRANRLGDPACIRQRYDLPCFCEYEGSAGRSDALITQVVRQIDRGEIGPHHPRARALEAAAEGKARLTAGGEYIKITPFDGLAALCEIVPRALTGIEIGGGGIAATDNPAIFVKEDPLGTAFAVRTCRDDLIGESSRLGSVQRGAQLCAVLAGNMGHHEEIAVIEPDIQRQNLRIDPQHPQGQRHRMRIVLDRRRGQLRHLRSDADDRVHRIIKQLDTVGDILARFLHQPLRCGDRQLVRLAGIVPDNPAHQRNYDDQQQPGDADIGVPEWTGPSDARIYRSVLRIALLVGHGSPSSSGQDNGARQKRLPCPGAGAERRVRGRALLPATTPTLPSWNSRSSGAPALIVAASVTTRATASRTTTYPRASRLSWRSEWVVSRPAKLSSVWWFLSMNRPIAARRRGSTSAIRARERSRSADNTAGRNRPPARSRLCGAPPTRWSAG